MSRGGRDITDAAKALDVTNLIAAFSEEQIERIIGLSKSRLRYWAKTDFFRPSLAGDNPKLSYTRFYSFKDMVALRTLEMLRVQNAVPLQHLRKVAASLAHLKGDLWTRTTLYVVNRKVAIDSPEAGRPKEVLTDQYVLGVPLSRVIQDTQRDASNFLRRQEQTEGRVIRARGIAHNKPVIAGTRIPVASVVRLHEDGYSARQIIEEYPDLTQDDVVAALAYGGRAAA